MVTLPEEDEEDDDDEEDEIKEEIKEDKNDGEPSKRERKGSDGDHFGGGEKPANG